ncbi:MAG: ABC transporter permease subunit [Bacilli bacterium]
MMISITKKHKKILFYVLGIVLIFVIWEALHLIYNNSIIVPGIGQTFKALGVLLITAQTYYVLLCTLGRLILVLAICFILAFLLAIFAYKSVLFKKFIEPSMSLLKTLPIASIIIILIIITGHENAPYYVTAFMILPILYEGIYGGLLSISADITDEIKMQSKINFLVVKDIYFPLSAPFIITALLQSVGLGLKVMVMAEFIAQPKCSIGRELLEVKNNLDYDQVFAWTIILVIIVLCVDIVIRKYKTKHN